MGVRFLIDENRRGQIFQMIVRHNLLDPEYTIDAVQVGDVDAPPLGTPDEELLAWCGVQQRILISKDRRSLQRHLTDYLRQSKHMPGILLIRPTATFTQVIDFLAVATYAAGEYEWRDRIEWIPY